MNNIDDLQRLRSRDPVYLEALFRNTNPMLLKLLAANGYRNEEAEDLLHQTWEKFFANLELFEGRSELQTFVCGILFNKIREHRRARGRLVFEEDSASVMNHSFTTEGWWSSAPPDPAAKVYSSQISILIEECLDGLSEQQKSAFMLKEVEDEESSAICNLLGVNLSNLRVIIFRAKDKLRKCLEGKTILME